jgi:hypothetical protein
VDRGLVVNPLPPRQRLLDDGTRLAGYMRAVQVDAQRLDAPDTVDLTTALILVRDWLAKVQVWAES